MRILGVAIVSVLAGVLLMAGWGTIHENVIIIGDREKPPHVPLQIFQTEMAPGVMTRAADLYGEAPFGPNPLFRQGLPGQGTYVRFTTRGPNGLWMHVGYFGARLAEDNSPEMVAWIFDRETEMAHHMTFGTSGLTVWEPGFNGWGDTPAVHLGSDGVVMAREYVEF